MVDDQSIRCYPVVHDRTSANIVLQVSADELHSEGEAKIRNIAKAAARRAADPNRGQGKGKGAPKDTKGGGKQKGNAKDQGHWQWQSTDSNPYNALRDNNPFGMPPDDAARAATNTDGGAVGGADDGAVGGADGAA